MNKIILLVGGDPNSINSEIIYKSWKKSNKSLRKKIILLANFDLIKKQLSSLKLKLKIKKVNNIYDKNNSNFLKVINIPLKFKNPFDVSYNESSKYIKKSLNFAHSLAISQKIKGFINCPINKNLINKNRIIGVTELLAEKSKIKKNSEVMLIYNKNLSVVPLTTHINIKKVSQSIKVPLIKRKIDTLSKEFQRLFKRKPKIGVLGLNPHNSEMSKNSEEVLKIIPTLKTLKKRGLKIFGPLVADTIFIKDHKEYDVIVGMYHDQVLAPFKTLYHFDAINITLGLKYLRISPDHGPARNLIRKNKANYKSLYECIKFMNNFTK